jgi:hypothetical protein
MKFKRSSRARKKRAKFTVVPRHRCSSADLSTSSQYEWMVGCVLGSHLGVPPTYWVRFWVLMLRTHTWLGDLRLNSCRYSRTPGRDVFLCTYRLGHEGGLLRYSSRSRDSSSVDLVASDQVDHKVWRFYIRLGRYLLDRSFVLNSNNILIY